MWLIAERVAGWNAINFLERQTCGKYRNKRGGGKDQIHWSNELAQTLSTEHVQVGHLDAFSLVILMLSLVDPNSEYPSLGTGTGLLNDTQENPFTFRKQHWLVYSKQSG